MARAGLFDLEDAQIRGMKICPRHRHNLGKFWKPRTTCQHPTHSGRSTSCKGRHAINLLMSQDIYLVEQCETPSAARRLALRDFLIATSAIRSYTHDAAWPPCSTERTAFEKVVCVCVCEHFLPYLVCDTIYDKMSFRRN